MSQLEIDLRSLIENHLAELQSRGAVDPRTAALVHNARLAAAVYYESDFTGKHSVEAMLGAKDRYQDALRQLAIHTLSQPLPE